MLVSFQATGQLELDVWLNQTWHGLEYDELFFRYRVNHDTGAEGLSAARSSQAGIGEADFRVPSTSANVYLEEVAASTLSGPAGAAIHYRLEGAFPGNWTFMFASGSSRAIESTSFSLDVRGVAGPPEWLFTRSVGFHTLRTMDDAGSHLWLRSLGHGAAVARQASAELHVDHALYGLSWYIPTDGVDVHEYVVEGPGGVQQADDLAFMGDPAGTYRFVLDQVSAGEWPGRTNVLWIDVTRIA